MYKLNALLISTIVLLLSDQGLQVGEKQTSSHGDPKKLITAEYKLLNGKQLAERLGYPKAPFIESNLFAVGYLLNHSPRTSQVKCHIECQYDINDFTHPSHISEEIPCPIWIGPDGKTAH